MQTVRLSSHPMIYTPGTLQWCSEGYKTSRTKKEREHFIRLISEGWNLPWDVVVDILTGKIDWNIDGQDVVFRVEAGRMAPRN